MNAGSQSTSSSAGLHSNASVGRGNQARGRIAPEQRSIEKSPDVAERRKYELRNRSGRTDTSERDLADGKRSEEVDAEETEPFPGLPIELWGIIFSHLAFRARKQARLVCRSWYELIMDVTCKDEQLLCSAPYDWDTVVEVVQKSKRKILHLAFEGMNMEDIEDTEFNGVRVDGDRTLEFWKECGPRVKSLSFSNCESMDETMEYVVKYCNNLESLSLECSRVRGEGRKLCSTDCIESLIRMEVTRNSLKYFKLSIDRSYRISNNFLRAIYFIYPKIKRFSISCDSVKKNFKEGDVADSALLRSNERHTFTSIVNKIITSREELEGIFLSIGDCQRPSNSEATVQITSSIMPLHFPRLKEVELELMTFDKQHHVFFSRHKDLTRIDFELLITDVPGENMTNVMNSVLDSCPNLRNLRIFLKGLGRNKITSIPTVTPSAFANIVKSRLKTLAFNFDLEVEQKDTETVNDRLKALCISAPGIGNDAFRSFMKVFRTLNHLEVNNVNDDRLQAIFKYQGSLKSLKLRDCLNCTDYGFTGCRRPGDENDDQFEGFSIRRLNRLQLFDVRLTKRSWKITKKTIAEFKLPNLLYLYFRIDGPWMLYSSFMFNIFKNSPKLEGVTSIADANGMTANEWYRSHEYMKNIRYFKHVSKEMNWLDNEGLSLFRVCPALRVVTFRFALPKKRNDLFHVRTHYLDVVKHRTKVMRYDESQQCRIDREYKMGQECRISTQPIDSPYKVDKMWY